MLLRVWDDACRNAGRPTCVHAGWAIGHLICRKAWRQARRRMDRAAIGLSINPPGRLAGRPTGVMASLMASGTVDAGVGLPNLQGNEEHG